ncbi:MAG: hypothetical protein L3K10_04790 [Thermoplasmata archaeon]|nr:hypothetical protein [Thermoplasmata archaeon]
MVVRTRSLAEGPFRPSTLRALAVPLVVSLLLGGGGAHFPNLPSREHLPAEGPVFAASAAVGNFSSAIDRLVELLGLAGSGILSLVWARVALSWFSNDVTKKIQAKDRARDALIGTLLFTAAITGLFWGLAHWVLTGS